MSDKTDKLSSIAAVAALAILLTAFFAACTHAEPSDLFLVSIGYSDIRTGERIPSEIHRLGQQQNGLEQVWSSDPGVTTHWISAYSGARCLLIQEGDDISGGALQVFPMDNVRNSEKIETSSPGRRSDFRIYQSSSSPGDLVIDAGAAISAEDKRFVPVLGSKSLEDTVWTRHGELVLSGPVPEYAGGDSDVLGLREESTGELYCPYQGLSVDIPRIPDSVIQSTSQRGWALIAHDSTILAIMSLPDNHALEHRELLIFDRTDSTWHSLLMPGSQTAPRLINRWLIGVVARIDPKTDFQRMKGFPPVLTQESVIISPTSHSLLTAHLGKGSEILWIGDDSTVYYRSDKSLFKARIGTDDIVDRQLLLEDHIVRFVHWAFEGSLGDIQ